MRSPSKYCKKWIVLEEKHLEPTKQAVLFGSTYCKRFQLHIMYVIRKAHPPCCRMQEGRKVQNNLNQSHEPRLFFRSKILRKMRYYQKTFIQGAQFINSVWVQIHLESADHMWKSKEISIIIPKLSSLFVPKYLSTIFS